MDHITHRESELMAEYTFPSNGGCIDKEASKDDTRTAESLEKGLMQYG